MHTIPTLQLRRRQNTEFYSVVETKIKIRTVRNAKECLAGIKIVKTSESALGLFARLVGTRQKAGTQQKYAKLSYEFMQYSLAWL